ncbi:MAG: type II toxin-antitoxin system Phd/YefM family antitoxin [Caldilineaceae bacterium]|nr:type II toxin-antitoxin system Phd/YefM family antitoxin [Caldilineaceae bacterium]
MTQVTIHEAKTHLSKLIQMALDGEEVIIAKRDKPLVKLVVIEEAKPQRRLGGAADMIIHIADDFDEPLDDFADYMS